MLRLVATVLLFQAVFSSRTEVVVLPVTVKDSAGRPVTSLTRENFRVFDEGRPQDISTFDRGDAPVAVGLVVDHSQSMAPKLQAVIAGVSAFAESASAPDELFVLRFNDRVSAGLFDGRPFTNSPAQLTAVLSESLPAGATALYDGLIDGLQRLELARWKKRALIVISDGGDNASRHTHAEMVAVARRAAVVIYAVGVLEAPRNKGAEKTLRRLCEESGGSAYLAASASEAAALLTQIGRDLRNQYTIGFIPTGAAGSARARRIKVVATAPGLGTLKVQTRASYVPSAAAR